MAFDYRNFILMGLRGSIGILDDYQIIYRASGYYDRGILKDEDLQEIQNLINAKNGVLPEMVIDDIETTEGEEDA